MTLDVVIEEIDAFSIGELPYSMLSSVHGGPIASRAEVDGRLVPASPVYRLRLSPVSPVNFRRIELGQVSLDASSQSYLQRFWRTALGTIIRETGF
jgi:putative peptide zinc metalloprotease protein